MPKKELRHPHQVISWLEEWGRQISAPGEMILIGSAGLLWHAARIGSDAPLPENSMDADPITESDSVAELAYEALIGSEFEQRHGWHVNLMHAAVLREFPDGWRERAHEIAYGQLKVLIPSAIDLITAKLKRNEPRDRSHADYASDLGLL